MNNLNIFLSVLVSLCILSSPVMALNIDNNQQGSLLFIVLFVVLAVAFIFVYLGVNLQGVTPEIGIFFIIIALILLASAVYMPTTLADVETIINSTTINNVTTEIVSFDSLDPVMDLTEKIYLVVLGVAFIIFIYWVLIYFIDKIYLLIKEGGKK